MSSQEMGGTEIGIHDYVVNCVKSIAKQSSWELKPIFIVWWHGKMHQEITCSLDYKKSEQVFSKQGENKKKHGWSVQEWLFPEQSRHCDARLLQQLFSLRGSYKNNYNLHICLEACDVAYRGSLKAGCLLKSACETELLQSYRSPHNWQIVLFTI